MISTVSRRDALVALGGILTLPQARGAWAAEPLPLLHVGVIPIFTVAPHFAADKFGYFAAEGIATTTQPVQGGAVGIPGLVGGSFDVLYANSISVLTAWERGIDVRIIAEATTIPTHPPDVDALFMRKGDTMRTGKDLEGKIIAVNAKRDLMWLVMQGWIQKTGGDLDKITYREVPTPSMLDALKNGQVDAALVLDPFMTIGLSDPNFELLAWPSSTVMPGLPSSLWIVSGTGAETKTELIAAYVRGFRKGVKWFNEKLGTPEFIDLVASYTKTDPKLLAKMYAAKQPTEISIDALNRLAAFSRDYGILKSSPDVAAKLFHMPS